MNPDATLSEPKHLKISCGFAKIVGFAKAHTQNLGNLFCGVGTLDGLVARIDIWISQFFHR